MEEVIQARKIEIVDSTGKVRAIFGIRASEVGRGVEEGPYLAFLTPRGDEKVTFELMDEGREGGGYSPKLYMRSEHGEFSTELFCDDGAAGVTVSHCERIERMAVCEDADLVIRPSSSRTEGVEAIAA